MVNTLVSKILGEMKNVSFTLKLKELFGQPNTFFFQVFLQKVEGNKRIVYAHSLRKKVRPLT